MTKCQVIQVFMEKVFRDEINPGQKIKTTLGLNLIFDLEKIRASLVFRNPGIDGTTFQDSSAM